MEIERRALYNLMRMNWLTDPSMKTDSPMKTDPSVKPVEPWQVEDYRHLPASKIFARLSEQGLQLDKEHFLSFADEVDTPEELTALLLDDIEPAPKPASYDHVYLLLFELWRRYATDKPCLSIFCDELDNQMHLYDTAKPEIDERDEAIQDAISNLQTILDENTDKGADPHDVFKLISSNCAHDLESFLYDYIADQLDSGNEAYASDLLDGFKEYVTDGKWFDFLQTRLLMLSPKTDGMRHLERLIDHYGEDRDLEFNLELLAFMVKVGNREIFAKLVKKTLPLIEVERDFLDLLDICVDFYHYLDIESKEQAIKKIITKRAHYHIESLLHPKDPMLAELRSFL